MCWEALLSLRHRQSPERKWSGEWQRCRRWQPISVRSKTHRNAGQGHKNGRRNFVVMPLDCVALAVRGTSELGRDTCSFTGPWNPGAGLAGAEGEVEGCGCRRHSSKSKNAHQKFPPADLAEPPRNLGRRSTSWQSEFPLGCRTSSSRQESVWGTEELVPRLQTRLPVPLRRRALADSSLSILSDS